MHKTFAVIGIDKTAELIQRLPDTMSCGINERIVALPRRIFVGAKAGIPGK